MISHFKFYESFWLDWFKTPDKLGREVFWIYGLKAKGELQGDRKFLAEYESFSSFLQIMQNKSYPCWASVLPFKERNQPVILEKLYFDFDSKENIEEAWLEAKDFTLRIKKFYNAEALLCFSGNKGYNVYVWLTKPLYFEEVTELKKIYTKIQDILLKGSDYKTLDSQPYGDVKRVSRVPYTVHNKSGSLCHPINLDREPLTLFNLNSYVRNGLSAQFIDFCIKKQKEEQEEKTKQFMQISSQQTNFNSTPKRQCIEAALKKQLNKENGHKMRIAIAREYLSIGWKIDDIVPLFASQEGFDKEVTEKKIKALQSYKTVKPLQCKTISKLGFCLKEECGLWRWKKKRGIDTP